MMILVICPCILQARSIICPVFSAFNDICPCIIRCGRLFLPQSQGPLDLVLLLFSAVVIFAPVLSAVMIIFYSPVF
jgi:hypothetical protein